MKAFTQLLLRLEERETPEQKRDDLTRFFRDKSDPALAEILRYLLYPPRKRLLSTADLKQLALEYAAIPLWLYEESYEQTSDIPETLALIAGRTSTAEDVTLATIDRWYRALATANAEAKRSLMEDVWQLLTCDECIVWHKLITGTLHPAVTRTDIAHALAAMWQAVPLDVEQQLVEAGAIDAADIQTIREKLRATSSELLDFALAETLRADLSTLGPIEQWAIEPKWSGIRAHLYRHDESVILRTRHDALLSDRFPEITSAARALPADVILDGMIVAWKDGAVLPLAQLEQRLTRKSTPAFRKSTEVRFIAFDVLRRNEPTHFHKSHVERQDELASLLRTLPADAPIIYITPAHHTEWAEVSEKLRDTREGFIAKRRSSGYSGGSTANWIKIKPEGHSLDVVLMYAERAMNGSDLVLYSFGVWQQTQLISVAKLPLTNLSVAEKEELDSWIMANTLERFGPVRTVPPLHVFRLDLERAEEAPRRKSGVSLRGAVIVNWRRNAKVENASTLRDVQMLAEH